MHEYYFEKMRVWQNARSLTIAVYKATKNLPPEEKYVLKTQIIRAANSVKSNIAEGQGRNSKKEQIRFTSISYSSLIELLNHIITLKDLEYISEENYHNIRSMIELVGNQLNALKKSQLNKI